MQAGESLSFVVFPDELAVKPEQPEDEKELVKTAFGYAFNRLMRNNTEHFNWKPVDDRVVIEGSFQVLYSDGSYIHLVAYRHSDSEGLLDLGVSVAEHDEEGNYRRGYLFEMDNDGVTCGQHHASGDEGEDEAKFHFSVLAMYDNKAEIETLLLSENPEEKAVAEDGWRAIHEAAKIGQYEKELGFSIVRPTLEDIAALQALMQNAIPFVVPEEYL